MTKEIFDKFYGSHWFLTGYMSRQFSELLLDGGCDAITEFIGIMENDVTTMVFDDEQFDRAADCYSEKLMKNRSWRERMYKKFYHFSNLYFRAGERLQKLDFLDISDAQLARELEKAALLQEQVRILGIILNGLVIDGRSHLSNKLRKALSEKINDKRNFDRYWSVLTQVTKLSMRQKKDIAIARLAELSKTKDPASVQRELRKIHDTFCWLNYMYYGPPMTFAQFQRELKAAIKHNENLHLRKDLHDMGKRQESLMDELRLDGKARSLVELSQCVLWQKGYRKDVEYHGFYSYEPLLREIARRKKERDWRNLLFLTPRELKGLILHGTPSIHDAKERRKFSCLIAKKDGVKTLTGHRARTFYDGLALENGLSKLTGTSGQCAYPGKARGIAKKILVPEDMKKMKKGDIIVSQATSPDLMPAIHKAAAIVTNTGGLICHAAIIARELKIPCIVGTANATRIFEDGDTIEVDAIKGTVRKIK